MSTDLLALPPRDESGAVHEGKDLRVLGWKDTDTAEALVDRAASGRR
jgi:hypothetical protein